MAHAMYTMDSLNQALREKDIFNIDEVEFALLESNGKLSVMKKPQYRNVMMKDWKGPAPNGMGEKFPLELIIDGRPIKRNLRSEGLSEEWLHQKLKEYGCQVSEVFYAVRGSNGRVYVDFYEDSLEHPIDNET